MLELRRQRARSRFSPTIWTMTLEFARLCGWVPQGTQRRGGNSAECDGVSDGKDLIPWHADYISNDGQTVTGADATLLADALTKAATQGSSIISEWQAGRMNPPVPLRTPPTGFRWFGTPPGKEHLLAIAAFCRRGEFQIC